MKRSCRRDARSTPEGVGVGDARDQVRESGERYLEPLLAWRFWRIRRLETLGSQRPLRLAAAGRRGIPKFWEPRRENRAVCSNPSASHEAPWPTCRCGIYGFRDREIAERALYRFSRGKLADWALGRVSLWGAVVEHEHGWRAQYAYPYELIVYTRDAEVASDLRGAYAVDVGTASPRSVRAPETRAAHRAGRARRHGERETTEPLERARDLYGEWLRGLQGGSVARVTMTEEEFSRAVGETLRLHVQEVSRLFVEELALERQRWSERG
jgi:hypothetical protein